MSLKIILQPEAAPLNHRLINPITLLNTVLTNLTGISDVVCVHVCAQLHLTVCPHALEYTRLLCPWDFPGKNASVGGHFLLLGNLPDPGIEPSPPAVAGGFFFTEPPGKSGKSHERVSE